MTNPWKRLSKINPQREDGNRQINSDVLDALVRAKLPTAEMGIVLTVISKTWGFNKQSDAISVSQLSEATGFTPRAIQKANAVLIEKRIIAVASSKRVYRGSPLNEYLFNKHYDTWKSQDRKRVNSGTGGELGGKKRVNHRTPTIETNTIENADFVKSAKNHPEEKFYLTAKKKKLTGKRLEAFERFWVCFDFKHGKAAAADSWLNIPPMTNSIVDEICKAAEIEAIRRKDLKPGQTPKWAQGWLTERRWEDECYQKQESKRVYGEEAMNV